MAISVNEISLDEAKLELALSSVPLWADIEKFQGLYKFKVLKAFDGDRCEALWILPFSNTADGLIATRTTRVLPYHPPFFLSSAGKSRYQTTLALANAAQEIFAAVEIPLSPNFQELGPFSACGYFIEMRHTHLLPEHFARQLSASVKNDIRHAERTCAIVSEAVDAFQFERAIVGDHQSQMTRKAYAIAAINLKAGFVLSAYNSDKLVGQILIIISNFVAYQFHSWFDRDGPRGVPSALIRASVDRSYNEFGALQYDLEGSVLSGVDRFFSSLGGNVVPYGILYWHRHSRCLIRMLEESLLINGRRLKQA